MPGRQILSPATYLTQRGIDDQALIADGATAFTGFSVATTGEEAAALAALAFAVRGLGGRIRLAPDLGGVSPFMAGSCFSQ